MRSDGKTNSLHYSSIDLGDGNGIDVDNNGQSIHPVDSIPPDWEDWLISIGEHAAFCQSTTWAEIDAQANGTKPHVVSVDKSAGICIGALIGSQNVIHCDGPRSWLRWLRGRGSVLALNCFEGPVIAPHADQNDLICFLDAVDMLAVNLGAGVVRFITPPAAGWVGHDSFIENSFKNYGYKATSWCTALVDLIPDEDAIFARINRSARKGIRRCKKDNVSVKQCVTEAEFLNDFCSTYYVASGKNPLGQPHLTRRALAMWRLGRGAYRFFIARSGDGHVLGTLGSYSFNGFATEIMSSRTAESDSRHLPVQDLLHWELFRTHKALGDHLFNLAGFSPSPSTPKEAGIRRFKEKWGGRTVKIAIYEKKFVHSWVYRFRRHLDRLGWGV